MVLAAAGAVDHDQLVKSAEQVFGSVPDETPDTSVAALVTKVRGEQCGKSCERPQSPLPHTHCVVQTACERQKEAQTKQTVCMGKGGTGVWSGPGVGARHSSGCPAWGLSTGAALLQSPAWVLHWP